MRPSCRGANRDVPDHLRPAVRNVNGSGGGAYFMKAGVGSRCVVQRYLNSGSPCRMMLYEELSA